MPSQAQNSQSMVEVLYQPPGNVSIIHVSQVMVEALVSIISAPPYVPINQTSLQSVVLPKKFQESDKYK